jgi:N-acetylglucosamine kinase-like BadF-type ATPase
MTRYAAHRCRGGNVKTRTQSFRKNPMARKTSAKTSVSTPKKTAPASEPNPLAPPFFTLGMEGGGTKTTWVLLDSTGVVVGEGKAGPANVQLLTDAQIIERFQEIQSQGARVVHAIGGAFAGCRQESIRIRIKKAAQKVWSGAQTIVIGEDTESALAGALGSGDGVIVIAGTGSNTVGRKGKKRAKVGGWGHIFGDDGSGYDVARRGLQAVYAQYNATEQIGTLGREYLKITKLKNLDDLGSYVLTHGSKTEVASLCPAVFTAAKKGDKLARQVIATGIAELSKHAVLVLKRLGLKKTSIGLIGSLFECNPGYLAALKKQVSKTHPGCRIFVSTTPGAIGAARMVQRVP